MWHNLRSASWYNERDILTNGSLEVHIGKEEMNQRLSDTFHRLIHHTGEVKIAIELIRNKAVRVSTQLCAKYFFHILA